MPLVFAADRERLERRARLTQAFVDKCQKMADEGFDIVMCERDIDDTLPELARTFTTFNKPDGTISSYFKPAKPARSANANTGATDNTEEAEQSEI
jgi:hypothetical protein